MSKKHDEKMGWGPWIKVEEITYGSVLPEGSRIFGSASPVLSSLAMEAEKESINDPLNTARNQLDGEGKEAIKIASEISDASSHSDPTPHVIPPKESSKAFNVKISNGRKRTVLELSSTCPLIYQGKPCGRNVGGEFFTGVGRGQRLGNKLGQVYKPKSTANKALVQREPITEGGTKKKKLGDKWLPILHYFCLMRSLWKGL